MLVNKNQKGNPILKYLSNTLYHFEEDIVADYIIGTKASLLYLSLKFHALYPEYIHRRLKENINSNYPSKFLLCYVDVVDPKDPIIELTIICLIHDWTLILAWSYQECARYIGTLKKYQLKPATVIKEKTKSDRLSIAIQFLSKFKGINTTDAMNLVLEFGSLKVISQATKEQLLKIPGFGLKKVEYFFESLHYRFKRSDFKSSTQTPSDKQ